MNENLNIIENSNAGSDISIKKKSDALTNDDQPLLNKNSPILESSANMSNKDTKHLDSLSSQVSNNNNNNKTELCNSANVQSNNNLTNNLNNSNSLSLMCRICHCEETSEEFLISPCYCTGTLKFVHQTCLQQWLKSNDMKSCELCKFDFIMQTKIRSFKNWEKLDMNNIERRKILCSVMFHLIAITCVVWSLYVLIQKTADEMNSNKFEWSFWTKLVVVAIGFTGGVLFMYIQCKMYFQLCLRWKQYNRVIIIQPITDEILKNSKKKLNEKIKSFTNNNLTTMLNNNNSSDLNKTNVSTNQQTVIHLADTDTTFNNRQN